MEDKKDRKLRAVLFADIDGYTAMMQKDEEKGRRSAKIFRDTLSVSVPSFGGEIIHFLGDGCICIFESSSDAVRCAGDVQKVFRRDPLVPVRIGIHSGDVFFEEESVYGDAVNLASRIESCGIPGSILFSERVARDVSNQNDIQTSSIGQVHFKNVREPIHIYALAGTKALVPNLEQLSGKINHREPSVKNRAWVGWTSTFALIVILLLIFREEVLDLFGPNLIGEELSSSSIAVLDFKNNTSDASVDFVGKMVADRLIHSITLNEIATVVSEESIEEYTNVMVASTFNRDPMDLLARKFGVSRVIQGNIYPSGDDILLEATISDPKTKKVITGLPPVKCSLDDPSPGVEELRQLVMGALAIEDDRDRNLLLESNIPKFAAYRELALAKEAEDKDREIEHLNKAIELDPNYFEAHMLRLSHYYNIDEFAHADSLLTDIKGRLKEVDHRQRNLLNFYDALLTGRNNLIFKHLNDELLLAPFDLITNTSVIVLGLQFINDPDKSLAVYQYIDEDDLDYGNCARCRTRLYLKMQIDLEHQNNTGAKEVGENLIRHGGWDFAKWLMIRALVRLKEWDAIEGLLDDNLAMDQTDQWVECYLRAVEECLLTGEHEESSSFLQKAEEMAGDHTEPMLRGRLALLSSRFEDAVRYFQQIVTSEPQNYSAQALLAASLKLIGSEDAAETQVTRLDSMREAFQFGEIDYQLARVYALTGDTVKALDHLRKAVSQGNLYLFHSYANDFVFRELQDEKEFQEVLTYWQ